MEKCAACGLPVSEGQRRCLYCGEPVAGSAPREPAGRARHAMESVCGKCGALLPGGCEACLVCGTKRDEIPFEGKFPVLVEELCHPEPYATRAGSIHRSLEAPRRWGALLAMLLVAVTAGVAGLSVWRQYFDTSGYRAAESVVYQSEDGVVWLSHPGLAAPVAVDGVALGAGEGRRMKASPNGRYLVIMAEAGGLFRLDLAETASSDIERITATRIAENAEGPVFYTENSAALAYRTATGELYATDYEEHRLLDADVDRLVAVEGRRVLYTRREEGGGEGRIDLYLGVLDGTSGERLLLDRDVTEVLDWTPGFERILYTANHSHDGLESVALLSYESKNAAVELLVEGVAAVLDVSAAEKAAFYLVGAPGDFTFERFISDDLAASDAGITRPLLRSYPALVEAIDLYGEDANLAEVAEREDMIIEKNAYESALRLWDEKRERDGLRRRLRGLFGEGSGASASLELWSYRGGESVLLDADVLREEDREWTADAESGFAVYRRTNPASLRKASLSAIWRGDEPMLTDPAEYYAAHTREELRHVGIAGEATSLFIGSAGLSPRLWCAVNGGSGVYFTVGPADDAEEPGEMFYADMSGKSAGAASVAERVNRFYGGYRDGVVYGSLAWGEESLGVIPVAGEGSLVASGLTTRFAGLENEGRTLLVDTLYPDEPDLTTLTLWEGDAPGKRIADNVARYDYRSDILIYLEKEAGAELPPDLYVWQGGEARLLEKHPAALFHPEKNDLPARTGGLR